ncbi:MAG TPA: hypothetical protein VND91_08450 [Candidatus Saccharimonadia bacterium]|nr:hypothetical protein [Candidatus Saccharimonadia bacterium]
MLQPIASASAQRIGAFVVVGLVLWAIVRAATFLSSEPLLALANNYDMVRVQGCIDAYPIRSADVHPAANSYEAPIARYEFRDDVDPGCYFTSEVLFAWASLPLIRSAAARSPDGGFPIRLVGAVKFAAFALVLVLGAVGIFRRCGPVAAVALGAVAVVVLADPAILLYAHGFYAEFAAFVFLLATMLALATAGCGEKRAPLAAWIGALAIVGLTTSKVQHLGLGLAMAVVYFVACRLAGRRDPMTLLLIIVAGLAGVVVQSWHYSSGRTQAMQRANITHTVLSTLFVVSQDPYRTAERLGLPRQCADHAGKNWYTAGLQENLPCPELYALSRARLLTLAVTEPGTLLRTYFGGFLRLRPWIPDGLGVVEGESLGRLPAAWFTWARQLEELSRPALLTLLLAPAVLTIGAALVRRRRPLRAGSTFLLLALAWLPFPMLGAVVFGDGYLDTPKQGFLIFACVLSFWVALGVVTIYGIARAASDGMTRAVWAKLDARRSSNRSTA